MTTVQPSELFADLRALPLQTPMAGAASFYKRYGSNAPLLLVSLFVDLIYPLLTPADRDAWLDRAPGESGKAIASSIRILATAETVEQEAAAMQTIEDTFLNLAPADATLAAIALVTLWSKPNFQALLTDRGTEEDDRFKEFLDTDDGKRFQKAVQDLRAERSA